MTPTKKLARVLTDETDGGYRLTIETVDGEIFRVLATEDQVNDLIDELDEPSRRVRDGAPQEKGRDGLAQEAECAGDAGDLVVVRVLPHRRGCACMRA